MELYHRIRSISEGTYGWVYQAHVMGHPDKVVALKKVRSLLLRRVTFLLPRMLLQRATRWCSAAALWQLPVPCISSLAKQSGNLNVNMIRSTTAPQLIGKCSPTLLGLSSIAVDVKHTSRSAPPCR